MKSQICCAWMNISFCTSLHGVRQCLPFIIRGCRLDVSHFRRETTRGAADICCDRIEPRRPVVCDLNDLLLTTCPSPISKGGSSRTKSSRTFGKPFRGHHVWDRACESVSIGPPKVVCALSHANGVVSQHAESLTYEGMHLAWKLY